MICLHQLVINLRLFQAEFEQVPSISLEVVEKFNQVFKLVEGSLNTADVNGVLARLIFRL